jgi:hypothetical protein
MIVEIDDVITTRLTPASRAALSTRASPRAPVGDEVLGNESDPPSPSSMHVEQPAELPQLSLWFANAGSW